MRRFIKGVKEGFHLFGNNVASLVNTILLTLVYFLGVGLTSLFAKSVEKNFLDIKKKDQKSYWKDLSLGKKDMDSYYKQY